ncbi:MOSC domain-containing protein [Aureimonas flava]|uniref:MOSC domain-containing protein n=1 Tax=Aureimonas flava TaxID=2320271 RepID=A0A3A1WS14_9HYPH|nr:MOSC domain-containing protein [Aureimonas flava]RIY03361.1 MOSC domain-containing protein [Aureimonas flava]
MDGEAPERVPARTLEARVDGLFAGAGSDFETRAVEALDLTFDGLEGDRHGGPTRRTGGREPWYPRGTRIRNERQISILSRDELAALARDLAIPRLEPEWIGANMTLCGVDRLSWLPPRTLLFFEGGATLKLDGDNAPCRASGRAIARHVPERPDVERAFVRHATHRRGLVAWVEKPGRVVAGERVELRLPEQWIFA